MDQAIAGKWAGDKVSFGLPPGGAFGEHDPNLTFSDDIKNVPPQFRGMIQEVRAPTEREPIQDASGASCATPSGLH